MPAPEEHEKPEDLVDSPHQAEHTARSLQEAADSDGTLQGYYAINDVKDSEEVEQEVEQDQANTMRRKGRAATP
jgi:hypothetical protein